MLDTWKQVFGYAYHTRITVLEYVYVLMRGVIRGHLHGVELGSGSGLPASQGTVCVYIDYSQGVVSTVYQLPCQ